MSHQLHVHGYKDDRFTVQILHMSDIAAGALKVHKSIPDSCPGGKISFGNHLDLLKPRICRRLENLVERATRNVPKERQGETGQKLFDDICRVFETELGRTLPCSTYFKLCSEHEC